MLAIGDIQHWAIHPGGPKILTAAAESLALTPAALSPSLTVLKQHGNMSSATLLFLLREIAHTPIEGTCVAIGFGPGLMAEALLLTAPLPVPRCAP